MGLAAGVEINPCRSMPLEPSDENASAALHEGLKTICGLEIFSLVRDDGRPCGNAPRKRPPEVVVKTAILPRTQAEAPE